MLGKYWSLLSVIPYVSAVPTALLGRDPDSQFEWTALGDSYASGVGGGAYVDGWRCLRYAEAYPMLLNADQNLAPLPHVFNNVVCSGAATHDVDAYQFYEKDTWGTPDPFQYGSRPKFGNPQMATLSVGGDDIDFPGIIFNCMLDTDPRGGAPARTCDEQSIVSWALLNDPKLVNDIDATIKKTVARGRLGPIGDKFRLYVTGYADFFNAVDPGCNTVTFARTANPNPDGKDHTMLTIERRKDFNAMSEALNAAIIDAVNRNADNGVKFVDIQQNGVLDGHRYCEPGVHEPDQDNPNIWFFHYPYNKPDNPLAIFLDNANPQFSAGTNLTNLTTSDYQAAVFNSIDFIQLNKTNSGDPSNAGFWDGVVGYRAKIFHPQPILQSHIKDAIMSAWQAGSQTTTDQASSTATAVSTPSILASTDLISTSTGIVSTPPAFTSPTSSPPPSPPPPTTTAPPDTPPTPIPTATDSCDVSYKFLFDTFQIRGKSFPSDKIGTNGSGLLEQLKGCGSVTKWYFGMTPTDPTYEWYASGHLPIGTKACVGRAVESAGGTSEGNCHGSG